MISEYLNQIPHNSQFFRSQRKRFLKALQKKVKILLTSIFYFSHIVLGLHLRKNKLVKKIRSNETKFILSSANSANWTSLDAEKKGARVTMVTN